MTLQLAQGLIRECATQYQLSPDQVWSFFKAGMVAAQVLDVFEAVDHRDHLGGCHASG